MKRKLDLSSLKSLKTKEKIMIIILAGLLVWAGYYRKLHRPGMFRIKNLHSQLREVQDKTFKLEDQISPAYLKLEKRLEDLNREYNSLGEQINFYYSEMPESGQISELLKFLTAKNKSSNDSDLEFIFVKTEPIEKKQFFQRLPLKISFTGDYNQIIAYLRRLEFLSRFFKAQEIQLQADSDILPVLNVHISLATLLRHPEQGKDSLFEQRLAEMDLKALNRFKGVDPFTASIPSYLLNEGDAKLPQVKDLVLSGVIWAGEVPSAVINGSVVKPGDDVEGLGVLEICRDYVILERKGKRVKLNMKSSY